jgi:hypothetical protein
LPKAKQCMNHFRTHEWEHAHITVHEKHKTVRTIPKAELPVGQRM